jgi:uncharacterized protein YodC (DUF2158 family)
VPAFHVGDVVCLRSGGCSMTVSAVKGDEISVVWMDGQLHLLSETVPEDDSYRGPSGPYGRPRDDDIPF